MTETLTIHKHLVNSLALNPRVDYEGSGRVKKLSVRAKLNVNSH